MANRGNKKERAKKTANDRQATLAEPPAAAPDNPTKPCDNASKDVNFKMPLKFHAVFKGEAALRGLKMKEMLEAAFGCFLDTYGSLADPDWLKLRRGQAKIPAPRGARRRRRS